MSLRPTVATAPLPAGRGCVNDVATLALDIPLFPVDRSMGLGSLAEARSAAAVRIGWAAIFLKAYAIVARETPPLRSWLAGRFRQRIATSSESVAVLAVNRRIGDEDRLFFARLGRPDTLALPQLQQSIDRFIADPVEKAYRRQLQLEGVPGCLRRGILRWNMRSPSPKRVARIGTFSLSTLAGFSATNRFHPTICTTSLSYGPIEGGRCLVTVIADHRVLDGAAVAKALARLENVLTTTIVEELRTARPVTAGAAA